MKRLLLALFLLFASQSVRFSMCKLGVPLVVTPIPKSEHCLLSALVCFCQNDIGGCSPGASFCTTNSSGAKCTTRPFTTKDGTVHYSRHCLASSLTFLRCRGNNLCCDTDYCNAPPSLAPPRSTVTLPTESISSPPTTDPVAPSPKETEAATRASLTPTSPKGYRDDSTSSPRSRSRDATTSPNHHPAAADIMSNNSQSQSVMIISVVIGSLCGCLVVVIIVVVLLVARFRRRSASLNLNVEIPVTINYSAPGMDLTMTGSGAGLPMLEQTSIARQTTLIEQIGCGRYGNVWKGRWMEQYVAVKVFASKDEQSWAREVEIYQTAMLRHTNILGFIAADNNDNGAWTQLWLVTDYCEFGSLFDFLTQNAIDGKTMLKLVESASAGLAHLHLAVQGLQGKPAIAHRDIKSRNYLVKKDCSCCLGDFGLAVSHDVLSNRLTIPQTTKVGTIRYMAPEILDESMNYGSFEAYKQADIYSLALVIWEITSRCSLTGTVL